jgi:hypothetical protein
VKRIEGSRQQAGSSNTKRWELGTRNQKEGVRIQNEKSEGRYLFSTDY